MPKIIIDENEQEQLGSAISALERLARFFDRLDDPYRMPEMMAQYYADQIKQAGGVDTYYYTNVGYGPNAMSLHMTFKKDTFTMEFRTPDGTRLMELRLHV